MRRGTRSMAVATTLLGLAVCAAACSGDGTGTAEPTAIEATVRADGSTRSGVTVRLFAPGAAAETGSAVTRSDGTATFVGLTPGEYEVVVEIPVGYGLAPNERERKPVTVSEGRTADVSFGLITIPSGGTVEVELLYPQLRFSPANLTIGVRTTVRWRNVADVYHTITPDGHSEWQRATTDRAGETFSHTFTTPGVFPYYCEPHAGMVGTITVQ